jgi:nucleotide-binding universal stress UspA family protein
MLKVLVPVDGSANSLRAVEYVIANAPLYKEPLDLHLLNVQHAFPGTVRGMHAEAGKLHHDEGIKALATARQLLDAAGVKYTYHINVGDAAQSICQFVEAHKPAEIVMGRRGMGTVASMLMGSVTDKVLHLVDVPIVLVK